MDFIYLIVLSGIILFIGIRIGMDITYEKRVKIISEFEIPKFIDCDECDSYCELGIEKEHIYSCENEDCHCRYAITDVEVEKY